MKTKKILALIAFVTFSIGLYAQGVINDGATITINSGTTVSVTNGGGYKNLTNGSNHGQMDLDGILKVDGDFTNNATNNVFINVNSDGEVVFAGTGTQTITSSEADMSNYIDFEKVTVNTDSETKLSAGSAMTVNGVFTVNSHGEFTSVTPTSDASAGSLITKSTISGTGDIHLQRYFKVGDRWQFISVPIASQTSTPLIDAPYTGHVNPNFYIYDETFQGDDPENSDYSNWADFGGMWQNVPTGTSLSVGQGYIWSAPGYPDVNATFSSVVTDLHTGDTNVAVSYTDNDNGGGAGFGKYYDGWNLVGNPFPSALDWDAIDLSGTSIDNTVYFWDGDNGTGNYIYHIQGGTDDHLSGAGQTLNSGATKEIPAYQSFSIHLTPTNINDDNSVTNENINLLNSARIHSEKAMYKNDIHEDVDFQFVRLKVENDAKFDETIVRFIDGTHADFNGKEDAFKMFPWDQSIPMIYSLTTETQEYPLAINSLPLTSIGTTIPLGFKTGEAGTFTIQCNEFNFDAGTDVKLIDTQENTETTLYDGAEYTFSYDGGDSRTRFYLFKGVTGIDDEPISEDIEANAKIWSSQDKVFITVSSYKLVDANVQIFDMLGRQVIDQKVTGAYNIIDMNGASGTYFVKIRTKDGKEKSSKVYISK